jgi:DDE family transposase
MIAAELAEAKTTFEATKKATRVFKELTYRTRNSWSRSRRVVAKAEHLEKGANPRFIVTSLGADKIGGQKLYEDIYCARGEMENRIKECQLDLFADRTSTATLQANQLRLWLSSLAYVLLEAVRRLCLKGTELANATAGTIRLKLLKIGAVITVSVRLIKLAFTTACPAKALFALAVGRLRRLREPPAAAMA